MFLVPFILMAFVGCSAIFSFKNFKKEKKIKEDWESADNFILSAGSGGVSLFELYMASENHAEVLHQLQRVASHILPEDVSPLGWANYLEQKLHDGTGSYQGLVNLWKGSLAEDKAVEVLNHDSNLLDHGIRAERFPSPNHPTTDIRFVDSHGHVLTDHQMDKFGLHEIQVKSYSAADAHQFLEEVNQNPDSHYMVNHELYQYLKSHDLLEKVDTDIVDGGWDDSEITHQVQDSIQGVTDSLNVEDFVPLVAEFLLLKRSYNLIKEIKENKKTLTEAGIDAGGIVFRLGVRGFAVGGGAWIGGWLGGLIMPGVGNIAGGVVGGFLAGSFLGKLIRGSADRIKYGKIMTACENSGFRYRAALISFEDKEKHSIQNQIYKMADYQKILEEQKKLARENGLDLTRPLRTKPSTTNALILRGWAEAKRQTEIIQEASSLLRNKLMAIFFKDIDKKNQKTATGFFGSLVLSNAEYLLNDCKGFELDLKEYNSRKDRFANHPYRLKDKGGEKVDEKGFLKSIAIECKAEAERNNAAKSLFDSPGLAYLRVATILFSVLFLALLIWGVTILMKI